MRLPLKLLTKLSALASIPFFFIFLGMGIVSIQLGPLMQVMELPPELSLFIKAYALFYLVGGLFGWAALFAGYRNLHRPTHEVPKWIFWGMGVGVVAFFSQGPAGIIVGFPPLVLAACLLGQFKQNRLTNHSRGTR